MFKVFGILAVCAALCGCKSAEEWAKADNAECESIGAQAGTQSYVDCRLRLKEMRAKIHAAEMADGPTVCNRVGTATICN